MDVAVRRKDDKINLVVTDKVFGKENRKIRRKAKKEVLAHKLRRSLSATAYICIALAYGASAGINAGFEKFSDTVAMLYKRKMKKRLV